MEKNWPAIKQPTKPKSAINGMLAVPLLKAVILLWVILYCFDLQILAAETSDAGNKILLNDSGQIEGQWRFISRVPQDTVQPPDLNDADWMPISVPGDINAALLKLKHISDPHFDAQATNAYWITSKEWWYSRRFDADVGRQNNLVLDGVDGTADIWLNGKFLGTMKDYFYPHRFNVTGVLKQKGNQLLVRFQSLNRLLGGRT